MPPIAILDIDGTLVDTNYHHALTWFRAFAQHGIDLPLWKIHRTIGKGGDLLVESLAGEKVEEELGEDIRAYEEPLYKLVLHEVKPFAGARELMTDLKDRGQTVVLASSAKEYEVDHYLDLLGARDVADEWTTSEDVQATKPNPDLVVAAVEKAGGGEAVLVGDTTWDCIAARRAGVEPIAVLTGGFSDQELREAGASMVFESIEDLRSRLDQTPLTA